MGRFCWHLPTAASYLSPSPSAPHHQMPSVLGCGWALEGCGSQCPLGSPTSKALHVVPPTTNGHLSSGFTSSHPKSFTFLLVLLRDHIVIRNYPGAQCDVLLHFKIGVNIGQSHFTKEIVSTLGYFNSVKNKQKTPHMAGKIFIRAQNTKGENQEFFSSFQNFPGHYHQNTRSTSQTLTALQKKI